MRKFAQKFTFNIKSTTLHFTVKLKVLLAIFKVKYN